MNFQEAENFLFCRLPMFSRVGKSAVKHGLTNIIALCELLGNPQNDFKSVHVAGTNGKGSTSHMIAATLQTAGYKVGLYTSPHLVSVRERYRIDGACVPEEWVANFVSNYQEAIIKIAPSYFELNVAMAFYFFKLAKVDIAVIETGLGGRMDSTNIIQPTLSVITSIALDHTDILGDTLEKIAAEKAGIIKPKVPVVIGRTQAETEVIFVNKALTSQSAIYFADTLFSLVKVSNQDDLIHYKGVKLYDQQLVDIYTDMQGDFQMHNILTSWAAITVLEQIGIQVSEQHLFSALKHVKSLTGLRGRWDFYDSNIILDVAHNPDGILQVLQNLKAIHSKVHIVYGSVKDKDVAGAVQLLPSSYSYYISNANVPRAMPVEELANIFERTGKDYACYDTVALALEAAMQQREPNEYILIIGSFFVVGEAYQYLESIKH